MRTIAKFGPATLAGAALLLAASLPAMAQSPDNARCLAIEDADLRVDCLEGTQESVEATSDQLPAPPTSLSPISQTPIAKLPKSKTKNSKIPDSKTTDSKPQSRERFPTSFNCAKAKTAIQNAICEDATLAEWDSRVGELLRQTLALQGKNKTLADDQRRWLSQRDSKCKSAQAAELNSCVLEMTKARLADLVAARAALEPTPAAAAKEQPEPTVGKEPPPAPERAAKSAPECPEGQVLKPGRTRPSKSNCQVQTSAKEREDFRRILRQDNENRRTDTEERPAAPAANDEQRPYEIASDTKLESADARLGYTTISAGEFYRDAREMLKSQKRIALDGAYLKVGNDERFFDSRMTALLARSGHSTDPGITLLTDQAPGDLRAYFSQCSDFSAEVDISCSARIRGRVTTCTQSGSQGMPCLAVEGGGALR